MLATPRSKRQPVHLLVDPSMQEALASVVRPDEVVVDVTLEQVVQVTAGAAKSWDCTVIGTEVDSRQAHDRALAVYQAWIVSAGDLEVSPGETVKAALAYRNAFSLWWFAPSVIKHYQNNPVPKLVQRGVWLVEHPSSAAVEALSAARTLTVWADDPRSCELIARFVEAATGAMLPPDVKHRMPPAPPVARGVQSQVLRASMPLRVAARAALFGARWVRHGVRLAARRRAGDYTPAPTGRVDVLLSTLDTSWTPPSTPGAAGWNRYLGDVPHRLADAGLSVAWLPQPTVATHLEPLDTALAASPIPVVWASPTPLDLARGGVHVARLQLALRRVERALRGPKAPRVAGVNLSELLIEDLRQTVANAFVYILSYEQQLRAIRRHRPRVVLFKNEFFPSGHVVAAAGASGGAPTWAFQHGTIPDNHWLYRHPAASIGPADGPFVDHLPHPARLLSYGERERNLMSSTGYPPERVVPIGSLRHDELFERARELGEADVVAARRALNLPSGAFIVAVCAQYERDVDRWVSWLVEGLRAAGRADDAHVAFKEHWIRPSNDIAEATFERLGWTDYSVHDGDLFELLIAADAMFSGTSTTVVEGAILGTPAICAGVVGHHVKLDYGEEGLAIVVTDPASTAAAVRTMSADDFQQGWRERRDAYLLRHVVNVARPAVTRLVEMIAALDDAPGTTG